MSAFAEMNTRTHGKLKYLVDFKILFVVCESRNGLLPENHLSFISNDQDRSMILEIYMQAPH